MLSLYLLFKFVHVAAAIVWNGGGFTLGLINVRVARTQDRAALTLLSRQGAFFGKAVLGPAALVTLLAGIAMVISSGLSFGTFWITWGFVGIFGSFILGGVVSGRAGEKLTELVSTVDAGDPRIAALQKRLALLHAVNLLLLFSVVWAMVFKPS
jgi:uncharacterized membrane protein